MSLVLLSPRCERERDLLVCRDLFCFVKYSIYISEMLLKFIIYLFEKI